MQHGSVTRKSPWTAAGPGDGRTRSAPGEEPGAIFPAEKRWIACGRLLRSGRPSRFLERGAALSFIRRKMFRSMSRARKRALLALVPLLLGGQAPNVKLLRGPYLQMGTPSGIIVRWRTDASSNSQVDYGLEPGKLGSTEKSPGDAK